MAPPSNNMSSDTTTTTTTPTPSTTSTSTAAKNTVLSLQSIANSPGTPLLHENLLFERKNRDPMRYYSAVAVLGEGSMGSVCKVKKRQDVGSARSSFLLESNPFLHLSRCWQYCCGGGGGGGEQEEPINPRSLLIDSSPVDSGVSLGGESGTCSVDTNNVGRLSTLSSRSISSMIRYGSNKDVYYALKSIHLDQARNHMLREELKNEVEILKTLDHPNIVRPIETFEYNYSLYLILEICSGGDLYTRDPYTENEASRITQSILDAVAYMHKEGISHRDLKFENIMFTSPHPNADVKIIDFGLSKKYGGKTVMNDPVGTIYSMSPEVLQGAYTTQADIWSCGVLTFMLLSSTMPFYGSSRAHVMRRIIHGTYEFKGPRWRYVSQEAKDFVTKLLTYEASHRPTAIEAVSDPWLTRSRRQHRGRTMSITSIPETMDAVQASIENFASYSTLKQLALMVVAHRSSSDEIGFLRRMFQKYDNGQGFVSLEGFKKALSEYEYSHDEMESIFRSLDVDRSGEVHYFEFLAATIEAHGYLDEDRLAEAFDRLDSDDSGFITVKDLRNVLGAQVPQSYLDKIIEEADFSQDRKVDYEEFLQMWNIESDNNRLKTLQSVAQRRANLASARHVKASSPSTDIDETTDTTLIFLNECKEKEMEDEDDDEIGDRSFNHRKQLSFSMSPLIARRTRSADI